MTEPSEIDLAFALVEQGLHDHGDGAAIAAAEFIEDTYRDMVDALNRLAEVGGCMHDHTHTMECLAEALDRALHAGEAAHPVEEQVEQEEAAAMALAQQHRVDAEEQALDELLTVEGEAMFSDYGLRHGKPLLREMLAVPPANDVEPCRCTPGAACRCRNAA